MIGTRLAHYEITERIGEGGMGVVWKATDTTLHRSVAIKVLPDVLARDPERLARLEREARLLAALSHPNIAAVYGLHEDGGVRFLAMELAPGESLAARLGRGQLAQDEGLAIALKIAEALEHAHEHGIVHRDLKPANVVIDADGGVKVLDFGLAKAFEAESASGSNPSLTQSPTITAGMTAANVVLGTAAYMSPEQARGHAADKRADIWSFGVVLYEMLTGARMFEGETISDVLAAVLRADFEWARLPESVPPRVRALLERCLERDRRARLRDIGEARITLAAEIAGVPDRSDASGMSAAVPPASPRWLLPASVAGAALLALVAGLMLGRGTGGDGRSQLRMPHRQFALPAGVAPLLPQIAPNGSRVAWMEADTLLVLDLDSLEPRRIPMRPASTPTTLFWSPDGHELGYVAGSMVRAIDMRTRAERVICELRGAFTSGSGATWGDDGIVTMSRAESDGLLQVPAVGGDAKTVAPTDSIINDYHAPHALPGGRGILFVGHRATGPYDNIHVFDGQRSHLLVELEGHSLYNPVYSPTGHILFSRSSPNEGVWAVPFSLETLRTTGDPFLVFPRGSAPSVANDGTVVHLTGQTRVESDLVLSGPDGTIQSTIMRTATPFSVFPALSPDGRRLVLDQASDDGSDLWVCDLDRGTRTRLTFAEGIETIPSWGPDGTSIVYQAQPNAGSGWAVMRIAADGATAPDTLARAGVLASLTPDGESLVYTALPRVALTLKPLAGGEPRPTGISGLAKAVVSPDGRFVAYTSDQSGRNEVYLQRYPGFEGRWQVSVEGGDWPLWNGRGDRVYFAAEDDVMVVDVGLGASPNLSTPRRLFTRPRLSQRGLTGWSPRFGMNAEGTMFAFGVDAGATGADRSLVLTQNWLTPFERPARP